MGIINYCIKQYITIYIREVLPGNASGSLTGSWSLFSLGEDTSCEQFHKTHKKIYVMESVFSNVPVLHLWYLRTAVFGAFQDSCFNYLAWLIFGSITKTPHVFAVSTFHFSLSA